MPLSTQLSLGVELTKFVPLRQLCKVNAQLKELNTFLNNALFDKCKNDKKKLKEELKASDEARRNLQRHKSIFEYAVNALDLPSRHPPFVEAVITDKEHTTKNAIVAKPMPSQNRPRMNDPATPWCSGNTALEMRMPDDANERSGPPTTRRQAGKTKAQ
ncbi:MAG: hypothetical protein Q9166_007130 [cf. Caloplaca sp. 2 TL-2023]